MYYCVVLSVHTYTLSRIENISASDRRIDETILSPDLLPLFYKFENLIV